MLPLVHNNEDTWNQNGLLLDSRDSVSWGFESGLFPHLPSRIYLNLLVYSLAPWTCPPLGLVSLCLELQQSIKGKGRGRINTWLLGVAEETAKSWLQPNHVLAKYFTVTSYST